MDQYANTKYTELPALAVSLKKHLHSVENMEFGFNHQDIGSAVLKKWRFADELVHSAGNHHKPQTDSENLLTTITAVGELLAYVKEIGYSDMQGVNRKFFAAAAGILDIKQHMLVAIRNQFDQRIVEAFEIFNACDEKSPAPAATHTIG